jgi:NDP-mannose synthase
MLTAKFDTAVIMAGGSGVRLRPLTYAVPKPLLPISKYTIIEYSIKRLAESGVQRVFVVTYYHSDKFAVCREYGKKYSIDIELIREETQLGTIGGLYSLRGHLESTFLMMNGDLVTGIDFADFLSFHRSQEVVFTLAAKEYTPVVPYGVLQVDAESHLQRIFEKPSTPQLINAGIYLVEPAIFSRLNGAKVDVPTLLQTMLREDLKVAVYRMKQPWIDIGHSKDYEQAIDILDQWENGIQ